MLSLTTIFSAILLGSMLFFAVVIAPSVHRTLGENEALTYTRSIFPKYYIWGIAISALATVMAIAAGSYTFILLLVVLIGFLYSRQILLKKISDAKDKWLASDSPQDKSRYKSLHKRSVIINVTQILILVLIVATTQVLHVQLARLFSQ